MKADFFHNVIVLIQAVIEESVEKYVNQLPFFLATLIHEDYHTYKYDEIYKMTLKKVIFLLLSLSFLAACTPTKMAIVSKEGDNKRLFVLPDGTMEFKGRVVSSEDVVIYNDGRGGERAAVKLDLPLYNHAYRDSILVERITLDMPVARTGQNEAQGTF